ncbi:ZinT/AdcA family metal-binding protein [Trueperella bialowiezensis]|uniref:Zinc/cadmium-binding protein n=1 Tax=Trueperella bialowiezensis TaxID=312285 RepID=A0A448PDH3_9ACTO|nr:ZinT/AdcA family metal-binding protein [Trueperella bialowiezensis]VEI12974.1 zinc/cadmium-binding protein [Trueperella bialowiezensis]
MTTRRPLRAAAAAFFAAALALGMTACSNDDGGKEETTAPETSAPATEETTEATDGNGGDKAEATLADWEGTWVSLDAISKKDSMKPHAEEAAKEHGETYEEIMEEVGETLETDFAGFVVDAERINFFDGLDDADATKAADGGEYKFTEVKVGKHDDHEFSWFIFEGGEGAKYKYVALMELHGEESLAHFHMRYGDDLDAVVNPDNDHWFPTFVNPKEGTDEQLAEVIFHHDH